MRGQDRARAHSLGSHSSPCVSSIVDNRTERNRHSSQLQRISFVRPFVPFRPRLDHLSRRNCSPRRQIMQFCHFACGPGEGGGQLARDPMCRCAGGRWDRNFALTRLIIDRGAGRRCEPGPEPIGLVLYPRSANNELGSSFCLFFKETTSRPDLLRSLASRAWFARDPIT